jgi:glycerate-2-kinase
MPIKNRAELISHGERRGRELVLDILEGGLAAADPYANTRKLIRREGSTLHVGGQPSMDVSGYGDELIDLDEVEHIYVLGAGKAVQRQAEALEDLLGDRLTAGAIVVKHGEGQRLKRIEVTEAAHPVPDEHSVAGARTIAALADRAGERDLVFTIFSDGASSLFTLPAPGLDLDDLRRVFFLGIKYGSQQLIHQVMPYFSAVNSGRIITRIAPARTVNLIMQVGIYPRWHGDFPEAGSWVPSWPPGPRRMAEAAGALRAVPWWDELTPAVRSVLERADPCYEVPDREAFRKLRFSYWQPIDLLQMIEGARARAEALGLRGVVLSSHLAALSSAAASVLSQVAREVEDYGRPFEPPVALITGGHLDVPTGGAKGVGGRNQEFALLWARALGPGRLASKNVVVGAIDSDGTDGPGSQHVEGYDELISMAGGLVDGYTMDEAAALGVDVDGELASHNSTIPLMKLKSAINTGNTGACLGDLRVALVLRRRA